MQLQLQLAVQRKMRIVACCMMPLLLLGATSLARLTSAQETHPSYYDPSYGYSIHTKQTNSSNGTCLTLCGTLPLVLSELEWFLKKTSSSVSAVVALVEISPQSINSSGPIAESHLARWLFCQVRMRARLPLTVPPCYQ